MSAAHVLRTADSGRFEVLPIGIAHDGRWVDVSDAVGELGTSAAALPSPDGRAGGHIDPLPMLTEAATTVVFPLLHGPMGEDGTVQGLLELAGVPFIGAGVLASALCMDKSVSRELLEHHGLPLAKWTSLREGEVGDAELARISDVLGYPLFVKPANMGSSVGVTKAADAAALRAAVDEALRFDTTLIIEETIVGREIEVAVMGNSTVEVSVPGEIVPSHDFYDFEDKYGDVGAELVIPAALTPEEAGEAQALAKRAYECLRVEGMARVDLFYESPGRGFLVNEINTIPGFTPYSMFPRLWEASGVSYSQLLDRLVDLAIERSDRRRNLVRTPELSA